MKYKYATKTIGDIDLTMILVENKDDYNGEVLRKFKKLYGHNTVICKRVTGKEVTHIGAPNLSVSSLSVDEWEDRESKI